MKLLIAGSRTITNFDLAPYIPAGVDVILSGGAGGVDTLAEKYADANRISKLILRPDYKGSKNPKAEPLKRNDKLVAMCDEALIIWDGISRGTAYTIRKLIEAKKSFSVRLV
ncbi:MAG: hypothetical protein J1F63_02530 [Oscillospiraceae bacterium]|nr:hypothetical protein [Oscillospiraceae bacterium]